MKSGSKSLGLGRFQVGFALHILGSSDYYYYWVITIRVFISKFTMNDLLNWVQVGFNIWEYLSLGSGYSPQPGFLGFRYPTSSLPVSGWNLQS